MVKKTRRGWDRSELIFLAVCVWLGCGKGVRGVEVRGEWKVGGVRWSVQGCVVTDSMGDYGSVVLLLGKQNIYSGWLNRCVFFENTYLLYYFFHAPYSWTNFYVLFFLIQRTTVRWWREKITSQLLFLYRYFLRLTTRLLPLD